MNKLLNKNILIHLALLFAGFLSLYSCSKTDSISLGATNEILGVQTVDTFAVDVNTILLDPLPTANHGSHLLGIYENTNLGKTEILTYLQFSVPDLTSELAQDVRFDSLSLSLLYDAYSYGDTTSVFGINVYELNESIDPITLSIALEGDEYPVFSSTETLYSNQEFGHKQIPLGSKSFYPYPHKSQDTINIKLNDELGKNLFQLALNKDSRIVNLDEFIEYFKGLVLKPAVGNKAVLGIKSPITMNLHYSYERQVDGLRVADTIKMLASDGNYCYHQVITDRSGSALAKLSAENPTVNSSELEQRAFIQGSSGVVAQIKLPYVNSYLRNGLTAINKAELIIEATESLNGNTAIPDSLILMKTNKYGTPTSYLTDSNGSTLTALFVKDNNWGTSNKGTYVFNVTDMISSWLYSNQYKEEESILVSLPVSKLYSTVQSLEIPSSNERPAIKLKITYTKINENEMVN